MLALILASCCFILVYVLWNTPASSVASSPALARVTLRDVQGLWGGRDLWLFADGRLIVQVVAAPGRDDGTARFDTQATPSEMAAVQAVFARHHFFDLKNPTRAGLPDEALPTITLETTSGRTHTVSKWANDKDANFDAIYAQLLTLATRAATTPKAYQGRYDGSWTPDAKLKVGASP